MRQAQLIDDIIPDPFASVAIGLVNTWDEWFTDPEKLNDVAALDRFLARREAPAGLVTDAAVLERVRALRAELRPLFGGVDTATVERLVGGILTEVRVQPAVRIDPDAPGGFAISYYLPDDVGVETWLRAVAGLGLTAALSRWGIERLRTCEAAPCIDVFVDSSRNGRRRYCGTLCQNRVNAAAHRKRKAVLNTAEAE